MSRLALVVIILCIALPVAAQTPHPIGDCSELEAIAFESWMDQFPHLYSTYDDMERSVGLIATYIEGGAEMFGQSECDWIRADYYQTAAVFYAYDTLLFTIVTKAAGHYTSADVGLMDAIAERYARWLLDVARPEVSEGFPFTFPN